MANEIKTGFAKSRPIIQSGFIVVTNANKVELIEDPRKYIELPAARRSFKVDEQSLMELIRNAHKHRLYVYDEERINATWIATKEGFDRWLSDFPQSEYIRQGAMLLVLGFGLQILVSLVQLIFSL